MTAKFTNLATDGDGTIRIDALCPWCSGTATVTGIPAEGFQQWQAGEFIQHALPGLTAGQRETLISGSHESCFDEAFPDE